MECFTFMNRSKTKNNMLKIGKNPTPIPILKQLKQSEANKDIVNKTN